MPDYQAGSASIRIGIDMRDFDRDLEAELRARDVELAVGIKPSDSSMADFHARLDAWAKSSDLHVTVGVRPDTTAASADLDAWRAREDLDPIRQRVEVDRDSTRRAIGDMDKLGADMERALTSARLREQRDRQAAEIRAEREMDAAQRRTDRAYELRDARPQDRPGMRLDYALEDADIRKAQREEDAARRRTQREEDAATRRAAPRAAAGFGDSELKKARNKVMHAFGDVGEGATLSLGTVVLQGVPGVVAGLMSVVDAAAKASHAIALIPAIGFGAGAAAGGIMAGIHGIPEALKDYAQLDKDPAATAEKQVDSLNEVSQAQYRVGESERAVQTSQREMATAERDLTDTYRQQSRAIRDLNDDFEASKLATEDATLGVSEAAKRLQQTMHDPTADRDTRERAQLEFRTSIEHLQQQQNKTHDLQEDTTRANTLGMEGSKEVVQAKQRVSDAANAEASAVHEVTQANVELSKALAEQRRGGAFSELDAALARLSPNAKALVEEFHTIGPSLRDIRKDAQDTFTAGLTTDVRLLAESQLPNLHRGLDEVDGALNTGLRASLHELTTTESQIDFRTSLHNTALGFLNASDAAAPLTHAMTTLVTVGTSFFPQWGQGLTTLSERFDNLVTRSAGNGNLVSWIQEGDTAIKEMGAGLDHVGAGIASVFRAANAEGSGLKGFDDWSAHLAQFLKSVQGQDKLQSFFMDGRDELDKWKPILRDIPPIVHEISDATRLWSDITMPFLHEAADLLRDHPVLVEGAVLAYMRTKTVGPMLDGVRAGWKGVQGAIKSASDEATRSAGAPLSRLDKFKAGASGALGLIGGGPWGLAMAAGGAAVMSFVSSVDAGDEAVRRFRNQEQEAIAANDNLRRALGTSGGTLDTGVLDVETQSVKQFRDALAANAADVPGFADAFTAGVAQMGSTVDLGGDGVAANYWRRDDLDTASRQAKDALDQVGLSNDELAQRITGSKRDFDDLAARLTAMGDGGREAAAHLKEMRDEWALDTVDASPVSAAIKDLGDRNRDTANSIDAATNAMERQRQGGLTLEAAQLQLNEALGAMRSAGDQAKGAMIDASGQINTTTQAGMTLYHLINDQLGPAWEKDADAAYRDAIVHGQSADQAQQASQRAADAAKTRAEQEIEQLGYTQAQADQLLQHYKLLDGKYNAVATLDTTQPTTALAQFQQQLQLLLKTEGTVPFLIQPFAAALGEPQPYHPDFGPVAPPQSPPQALGNLLRPPPPQPRAAGGSIDGGIPGRDSVLLLGMPGEHMLDTGDVDALGGQAGVYRFRAALHRGEVPRYDVGGAVSQQPTTAASRAQQVEQYAQGLNGIAYGGDWDCSGAASHVALDAVGLSPDSGRMSTANEGPWLEALGWKEGMGQPGDLRAGWINDPNMPGGGHTALTMPNGVNFESNGTAGVQYGGAAIGASNNLFNQHAYLTMSGGPGAVGGVVESTQNADSVTTQQVLYPQAPMPAPMSDQRLDVLTDQAAVDDANSQRNQVYADPKSTAEDKRAADYKLLKAQNALGEAQQKSGSGGAASLLSAQGAGTALGMGLGTVIGAGIGAAVNSGQGATANAEFGGAFGSKFGAQLGGILAGGVLSSLGLDKSVLSSANAWNQAFQKGVAAAGTGSEASPLGYMYQPQNLPATVTTSTPQAAAPTATPALAAQAPGATGDGSPQAATKRAFHPYGWDVGPEWDATNEIVSAESSWNPTASAEPASDAYGDFQFLSTTWATVGGTKTDDPYMQAVYGAKYIQQRYGDPEAALRFRQSQNPPWYDDGGIAEGVGLLGKNVIAPERVLSPRQTDAFERLVDALDRGSGWTSRSSAPQAWGATATRTEPDGSTTHNHYGTVHVNNPQVANLDEFASMLNRQQALAQQGAMAAMPA